MNKKINMKFLGIKLVVALLISGFVGPVSFAHASVVTSPVPESTLTTKQQDALSAYGMVSSVSVPAMSVPTVVGVPISDSLYRDGSFLVLEIETNRFIGSKLIRSSEYVDLITQVETVPSVSARNNLIDNISTTSVQFDVTENSFSRAVITLSGNGNEPITASTLSLSLAPHVSLPLSVSIRAGVEGEMKTVVSPKKMNDTIVKFPETTANYWVVDFTYVQPLRITELSVGPERISSDVSSELRFLAQPGMSYKIYSQSDRSVRVATAESGNLSSDEGLLPAEISSLSTNPRYTPSDVDEDGVRDTLDNCVKYPNPDQKDANGNGIGDDCEDYDRDGWMNSVDNCPDIPNSSQSDEDGDGIGDECDDEESRLTERHAWVPWVGMGLAGLVIIILFAVVGIRPKEEDVTEDAEAEHEPHQD